MPRKVGMEKLGGMGGSIAGNDGANAGNNSAKDGKDGVNAGAHPATAGAHPATAGAHPATAGVGGINAGVGGINAGVGGINAGVGGTNAGVYPATAGEILINASRISIQTIENEPISLKTIKNGSSLPLKPRTLRRQMSGLTSLGGLEYCLRNGSAKMPPRWWPCASTFFWTNVFGRRRVEAVNCDEQQVCRLISG